MEIRMTKEVPKSGSFIYVWTTDHGVFCDSYRWENGVLYKYKIDTYNGEDSFVEVKSQLTEIHNNRDNYHFITYVTECSHCKQEVPYEPKYSVNYEY